MPLFGRRYRRYRRYKRFYRRYKGRRGYSRKYVNASSKSNVRIRTSIDKVINLGSGTSAGPGNVNSTNCFGAYDPTSPGTTVLASPLYRTYCGLYEEVKCVGMKVSVACNSVVGNATVPSLQMYTAFDRRHGDGEAAWTAAEIKNSSTYNVATAINNNVAKISRSVWASDLMEKAQWHDCSLATDMQGVYTDEAYVAAAANPNFFSPCFFICLQSPTLAAATQVSLSIAVTYYMAFRNPKYGGSAAARSLVVGDYGDMDIGGDMDAGGDADDAALALAAEAEAEINDGDGPAVPSAAPPPTPGSLAAAARRADAAHSKRLQKTIIIDKNRAGKKNV